MDTGRDNTALLLALLAGAGLWWYWQQSQTQGSGSGGGSNNTTDSSLVGDAYSAAQEVDNYVEKAVMGNTRGERNNNPGNIRRTSPQIAWQGMTPNQTDSSFVQFSTPEYGIRAMHVNFLTYYNTYGLNTVRGIISRWAPANENNTSAYIANVAASMGVGPDDTVDLTDLATATALVHAVIMQENGEDIYTGSGITATAMAMT